MKPKPELDGNHFGLESFDFVVVFFFFFEADQVAIA